MQSWHQDFKYCLYRVFHRELCRSLYGKNWFEKLNPTKISQHFQSENICGQINITKSITLIYRKCNINWLCHVAKFWNFQHFSRYQSTQVPYQSLLIQNGSKYKRYANHTRCVDTLTIIIFGQKSIECKS